MKFELLVFLFSLVDAPDYNVTSSREPVHARVGGDAILPCSVKPPFNVTNLTVEWRWNGEYAYVYRSWKPDLVNQHEIFKGRTSLFREEMEKGNISLKVTNVTEAHAGNYTCAVPNLTSQVKRGNVKLIVEPEDKSNNTSRTDAGNSSTTAAPHPPESDAMSSAAKAGIAVSVLVALIAVVVFTLWKSGVIGRCERGNNERWYRVMFRCGGDTMQKTKKETRGRMRRRRRRRLISK